MAAWHVGLHTPTLLFCYTIRTIFFLLIIPPANPLWFNYHGFKEGDVKREGDASLLQSDIYVTSSEKYENNTYSVGRVTSLQPMHLWDMTSRNLTDFSANFSFIIYTQEPPYADGLAFFIADPNLPLLKNITEGGGLGLVDGDQVLNSTLHSFVAVEFDTFSNPWDPDGTHVGMNFNSMNSSITQPWSDNITSKDTVIYDCSIEYNSSSHNLSVSYPKYDSKLGLVRQYLSYKVDLREYFPEWVLVGFSAATGAIFEVHILKSWSFSSSLDSQIPQTPSPTSPILTPNPNPAWKRNIGILVGIGVGIGVAVNSLGLVCFLLWKWKKTEGKEEESVYDLNMDDEFQKSCGPKKFCHNELVTATNNFSEAEMLGHGGFGGVYQGFLKELNSYVAIKRISKESKQGIKEYATEVKIISQLRHKNLVQLIGWCHKKNDLLLIYEIMTNGSLDSHLYREKNILTWEVRYNIALDLASAVLYLHEEWEQCVLHRDIKSSNIMLDSNFNAKLGDFGLARLIDHKKGSQTTVIAGTRGYIAPEYFKTGKASKESDIYSFGIVLLEITTGRKPTDLAEDEITIDKWVWELYGLGKFLEVADPKLCGTFDEQQMERLVVVGIWCAHPDYSSRPSIKQVIQVLNFEAPLPNLPQKMPVAIYVDPTIILICS